MSYPPPPSDAVQPYDPTRPYEPDRPPGSEPTRAHGAPTDGSATTRPISALPTSAQPFSSPSNHDFAAPAPRPPGSCAPGVPAQPVTAAPASAPPAPAFRPGYAQPVHPQAQPQHTGPHQARPEYTAVDHAPAGHQAPTYPATAPLPTYDAVPAPQPPGYQHYASQQAAPAANPQQPGHTQPGHTQPGHTQPGHTQPGHAQPGHAQPAYAHPQIPAPQSGAGYAPPGYSQPGYAPAGFQPGPPVPGQAPRRSNVPLVAVIAAVSLLLCGGIAVAGVLVVQNVVDRTKEAVDQIPKVPELPEIPALPTDVPELPELPTDRDPYGDAAKPDVAVVYEVTGDGTVDITYTGRKGESPKRVKGAKLPWRTTVTMSGASYVSVMAFRTGSTTGSVNCSATVDGKRVAQRSAEGTFAVVTCSKLIF